MSIIEDRYGRTIDYLRISITDRCNLRCRYCMPDQIPQIPHKEILSYEEILRICRCAGLLGIHSFKVTGGEPFVRKDCVWLLEQLRHLPEAKSVTLTTNGLLLKPFLPELEQARPDGINISLDTLDPMRYREITGFDRWQNVWDAVEESVRMGFRVKLNCVLMEGVNDGEVAAFAGLVRNYPLDVRFIEMMPIGCGREYRPVPSGIVLENLKKVYPDLQPCGEKRGNGPARYYTGSGMKGCVGLIDAVSHKFCDNCNRIRLTADGFLKLCLYYGDGVDLKTPMRNGISDQQLAKMLGEAIRRKPMEHGFFDKNEQKRRDLRSMSGIGG